jgi:hypothetical protein
MNTLKIFFQLLLLCFYLCSELSAVYAQNVQKQFAYPKNRIALDLISWNSDIKKFTNLAKVSGHNLNQGKKLEISYDYKPTIKSSWSFRLILDFNQNSTSFKQNLPITLNDTFTETDAYFFLLPLIQDKTLSADDFNKTSYFPDGGFEIGGRYKNYLLQKTLQFFWSVGLNTGEINYLRSEERFLGNITTIKYNVYNSGFPWWNSVEKEYAINGKIANYGKKMKANYSTFSIGFGLAYAIPKSKISLGYEMDLNRRIAISRLSKNDLHKVWTNHSLLISYSF